MRLIKPERWTDYELIDTGDREKLERFGKFVLIRPEPQAVWSKTMTGNEWNELVHARYVRNSGSQDMKREERGVWERKPGIPDHWMIGYQYKEMDLRFRLGLTSFGHIGVFPEQAENWEFVYDIVKKTTWQVNQQPQGVRVLNLFAYTGGTSLAARAAGAEVVHVDSVKPVINWARENMESSGLNGIHWVVEDAMKFVRREVKRGNRYDGIILDPPAYGRGPEGEKWILEESINELISLCTQLLQPNPIFFILSLYSMGFSSLISENLIKSHLTVARPIEHGEFYFEDQAKRKLPLGTFVRTN